MYPVHGHKRLDDDALLDSLSLQESDGVVLEALVHCPVET